MNKTLIVLKHEFLQKVRSRAFIIMTLIGPLLMAAIVVVPAYFASTNTGDVRNLVVIDSTGRLAQTMVAASHDTASDFFSKQMSAKVTLVSGRPGPNVKDSLGKLVEAKVLTGYMTIPANAITDSASTAQIKLHNPSDFTAVSYLKDSYRNAVRDAKLTSRGIDPNVVSNVESGVHVETMKLEAGTEKKDSGDTGVIMAFITAFILYMTMILYGTIIMNSVIEEKSSRVIELIASSVRPFQLLVGKVLGVAGAGLIQIGVRAIMLVALTTVGLTAVSSMLGQDVLPSISPYLFL